MSRLSVNIKLPEATGDKAKLPILYEKLPTNVYILLILRY